MVCLWWDAAQWGCGTRPLLLRPLLLVHHVLLLLLLLLV
jgi:hypothetical protein